MIVTVNRRAFRVRPCDKLTYATSSESRSAVSFAGARLDFAKHHIGIWFRIASGPWGARVGFTKFEQSIESASLRRVALHWFEVRGARAMPGWNDLRLFEIEKLMPIIWAYRYDRAEDKFVGLEAGVNIEQIFGKSFTGTPMEDLYPAKDYPRLFARAKRVVGSPEFYRGVGMVFNHLDHSGSGERIMLPLATDGVNGDGVIGATVYQFFLGERVEKVPEDDFWFPL